MFLKLSRRLSVREMARIRAISLSGRQVDGRLRKGTPEVVEPLWEDIGQGKGQQDPIPQLPAV